MYLMTSNESMSHSSESAACSGAYDTNENCVFPSRKLLKAKGLLSPFNHIAFMERDSSGPAGSSTSPSFIAAPPVSSPQSIAIDTSLRPCLPVTQRRSVHMVYLSSRSWTDRIAIISQQNSASEINFLPLYTSHFLQTVWQFRRLLFSVYIYRYIYCGSLVYVL